MSAITAKASRKMKKYAVLTREPRCFLGSFDFSWEQRKLGDMMNVTSVKRIHQSDWTDSGVRFLRARDIVAAAKNEEPDDYLYISKEKYEEYSTLSGKVGVSDLLVTGVGTIGVPYLVRNLEPLYFKDGNIIWFQNSDKIDGKFLFYSFSAEQIQGFINESAGIGTVGTYTIESGKKTPISLPNQIEQAKVGEFFQQLDNLITLHQRKCIFFTGRAGRLISTVNKKRITSSWEQRKAKEICSIGTGKSNTQDQVDDGKYPFYIRSDVPVRSNKYLYDCEAVITIGDGNIGKVFHYVNGKFDLHQRCYKMTDFKDIWGKYFFYYFSTKFYDRAMKMTAKATVDSVRLEMISEMDIKKPPQISEQKQIAEFFANLDNLITLHQRKPFLMKWRTSDANRNQTNRLVL